MDLFVKYNKGDQALKAAWFLQANCQSYHKTEKALRKFVKFSKKAQFTTKEDLSKSNSKFGNVKFDSAKASTDMVFAHQLLKTDVKSTATALEALSADPLSLFRHDQAMKTHRRMARSDEKAASEYFAKAKAIFTFSKYFQQE